MTMQHSHKPCVRRGSCSAAQNGQEGTSPCPAEHHLVLFSAKDMGFFWLRGKGREWEREIIKIWDFMMHLFGISHFLVLSPSVHLHKFFLVTQKKLLLCSPGPMCQTHTWVTEPAAPAWFQVTLSLRRLPDHTLWHRGCCAGISCLILSVKYQKNRFPLCPPFSTLNDVK